MIKILKVLFSDNINIQKCFAIRKKVFVEEQNCDPKDEYENEEESIHFLLIKDNQNIATARYRKTEKGIKMERFAVLKQYRGKGFGYKILNAMLKDLDKKTSIKYLHAQVQVVGFYEKIGFEKVGDIFDEVGIMHYKMIFKSN